MTAARSDLKPGQILGIEPSIDRDLAERQLPQTFQDELKAPRLAASQPDREALKEFIVSASFASRAALDSDTIFCEIYTPGYSPAKKGSFGFFVKELRAILSLLSGASTKSDGGVEADTRANETAKALMAHPSPMGSRSCDEKTIACGVAGVAPGPSDPSPGPDVRRRVLDILNAVAPAVENLAGHQEQCDMDGVMVKVSRQALDEVLNAVNEVALVSALTRPSETDALLNNTESGER